MKAEGMAGEIQVDLDDFMGKDFVTFRKTKNYSEVQYSTKYNFFNFVNKHYIRRQNDILTQVGNTFFIFIVQKNWAPQEDLQGKTKCHS